MIYRLNFPDNSRRYIQYESVLVIVGQYKLSIGRNESIGPSTDHGQFEEFTWRRVESERAIGDERSAALWKTGC